jgi:hypothetical protein
MPEPRQPTSIGTVATTATSTPRILPTSTVPRPEGTAKSASSTAATSTPSILPATIPRPEASPTSPTTTSAEATPKLKPLKRRVVKHQPDQFRKGAISKEELSAIKKALKTIPWSRNSDPKAAADEDYAAIIKECEKGSVDGLLTDLVTEAVSNDYQPNNEAANSAYFTELNSNFDNGIKTDRKNGKTQ